jgi:hypothetical protein
MNEGSPHGAPDEACLLKRGNSGLVEARRPARWRESPTSGHRWTANTAAIHTPRPAPKRAGATGTLYYGNAKRG